MKRIVCLDPGHGGSDPGALGPNGLKESQMALDVCLRIRKILLPFVDVIMTRTNDKFVTLSNRAKIANDARAEKFLSYHFNSAESPTAHGWEIFTTRGVTSSDALASAIGVRQTAGFPNQRQRADFADGDIDKEANFAVLRKTNMSAVLIEGEFIHTDKGADFINQPDNRQKMAEVAAYGLLDNMGINPLSGKPTTPPTETHARATCFSK